MSRGDTKTKDVLKSERDGGKHFVSERPAMPWDRYTRTGNLARTWGKKSTEKQDLEAAKKKADRVKLRWQIRQQREQTNSRSRITQTTRTSGTNSKEWIT